MYPTLNRMINFAGNKAKLLVKQGHKIDVRVFYKDRSRNEKDDCTADDLKWCIQAFVKDYVSEGL